MKVQFKQFLTWWTWWLMGRERDRDDWYRIANSMTDNTEMATAAFVMKNLRRLLTIVKEK